MPLDELVEQRLLGPVASVARRIAERWRTWAAGRGEYLGSQAYDVDKVGFGATGRLSVEAYLSGVGIEPRGLFLGTYAIGLYVEAGARDTVAEVGKIHAGLGLTFRTPLVFSP